MSLNSECTKETSNIYVDQMLSKTNSFLGTVLLCIIENIMHIFIETKNLTHTGN